MNREENTKPKAPRALRTICINYKTVESEEHFTMECEINAKIRANLFTKVNVHIFIDK